MAATRNYKAEYAKRKARAIIKEREAKRGKPLSQSYKKRIERGLLQGKSLQQSRGHKPQEHVERKLKEIARFGLTKPQLRSIREFHARRQGQIHDHDFDLDELIDITVTNGFDWFLNYRSIWNAARATYITELRRGSYISRGLGYLTELTESSKAPEVSWLYYH